MIDRAVREAAVTRILPLFSGGHDSLCAAHVASHHPLFPGTVNHIDTGIGAKATRVFVHAVAAEYGWRLKVWKSKATYERFVTTYGFPGPGSHQWVYNRLKDRCVRRMMPRRGIRAILLTGCRSQESTRRMGHVEPVKIGETSAATGVTRDTNRVWVAPCHDWSAAEQRAYMDAHALPSNPVKRTPLGMSGECFCGAFASPGELAMIRRYAPDVAVEIDRLTALAEKAGTPCRWGERPPGSRKGVVTAETGPMCSSCDYKAAAAGIVVVPNGCGVPSART